MTNDSQLMVSKRRSYPPRKIGEIFLNYKVLVFREILDIYAFKSLSVNSILIGKIFFFHNET